MAKQASIELKNLTKEYVTHEGTGTFLAVDHINVNIGSGEFVTLLGPSGCGKTTTLRMIAGFESVSDGDILLDGIRINEMTPDKRDSSMVFQSYALFPHYDVYDNVAYGLVNKKMDKKTIREKVMQMVELVGLKGLEHRIDEPLSNLDAKLRVYMRKEIRKIQQRIGITSVYVTHDQAEAMSLSDKIIIMNKGHIEQVGTPHEVYQHPASRFVADFIGSANFVEAKVGEGDSEGEMIPVRMLNEDFNVHYAGLPVKAGDTVQIVLRPEAIRLADSGDVEAEVISSTYMGAVQEYVVRAGDKELETEEYNPEGKHIYRPGDKVWLRIQRGALHAVEN